MSRGLSGCLTGDLILQHCNTEDNRQIAHDRSGQECYKTADGVEAANLLTT